MSIVYGSKTFKGDVLLHGQKGVKFHDSDSSNFAYLKAPATIGADFTLTLPADAGSSGQVLSTNGSGVLSWVNALTSALASGSILVGVGGTATATDTAAQGDITASATGLNINAGAIVNADINASAAIAYSKLDLASSIVNADVASGAAIAYSKLNLSTSIVNADIAAAAAIALSKLAALTASRALVSDGSGVISASSVTSTELGYVSGVTSSIQTQLGNKQSTSEKGQANGYASLDAGGKVPVAQLPNSIMEYQGTYNASTNTPTLVDGTGNQGDVYRVTVAGSQNFGSGSLTFVVGDYVIYNGSVWELAHSGADAVVSVNGSAGVVTVNAINELTGDVTTSAASGSQSKVATIANDAITTVKILNANVTNAKLATGIDAAKLADGSVSNAEFQYLDGVTSSIQTQLDARTKKFSATWANADGASKAVTHSLGSKDVIVQIYDLDDDSQIEIDSIVRTSTSVVTLTASQAPAVNWRVVVIG
jgi:hypothetical protein